MLLPLPLWPAIPTKLPFDIFKLILFKTFSDPLLKLKETFLNSTSPFISGNVMLVLSDSDDSSGVSIMSASLSKETFNS